MELPSELHSLYKHWGTHSLKKIEDTSFPFLSTEQVGHLMWFIKERMSLWEQKQFPAGSVHTDDKIFSQYRFCNIYRELDRQTIHFHMQLKMLEDDFPLWLLNMFYLRMIARPETTDNIGLLSFDSKENKKLKERLQLHTKPTYGTAYVFPISTILKSNTPTRETFLSLHLPSVIPEIAKEIKTQKNTSINELLRLITPIHGFQHRFLWTEVLIDVAYQYPEYISLFKDFPIGPGALPTLTGLFPSLGPDDALKVLSRMPVTTGLTYRGKDVPLSLENWEGICCEYRKYNNLSSGRGRKRLYK